jgi:hypothetical protein
MCPSNNAVLQSLAAGCIAGSSKPATASRTCSGNDKLMLRACRAANCSCCPAEALAAVGDGDSSRLAAVREQAARSA